jgi:transposase
VKAFVPDPAGFVSGRHFAAWLGLTPKPHSSGGKERLGGISKMGNPVLRSLLVLGAASVPHNADGPQWLIALLARRPARSPPPISAHARWHSNGDDSAPVIKVTFGMPRGYPRS